MKYEVEGYNTIGFVEHYIEGSVSFEFTRGDNRAKGRCGFRVVLCVSWYVLISEGVC